LLQPGGARFSVSGDDDVVPTKLEVIPYGRIEMMIVELASLDGEFIAAHALPHFVFAFRYARNGL
jgi:hypothetical protein